MLQTIKSTLVVGTLLIVGYGVHVLTIKPRSGDNPIWNNGVDLDLPDIDTGGDSAIGNDFLNGANAAEPNPKQDRAPAPVNGESSDLPEAFPKSDGSPYPTTGAAEFPPMTNFTTPGPNPGTFSREPMAGSVGPSPIGSAPSTVRPSEAASSSTIDPASNDPRASRVDTGQGAGASADLTGSSDTAAVEPASHAASAFDDMWNTVQQKLQGGDLVNALLNLSLVYSDESLYDVQRDKLITMLDQLAGTVIYSPQHFLSSPHVVAAGDTWESIAQQWQVPAAFLSRVNGMALNSPLQQGQQLKVVSGPFRAEISLSRRELTLYLGRYYAGRFNVGIGRDLPAQVTSMEAVEKSGPRPYFDARTGQTIPPGAAESPYGQFWIGLRSGGQVDSALGIHDTGPAISAADTRGCITVSARDADDLQAILSVGSRLEIIR